MEDDTGAAALVDMVEDRQRAPLLQFASPDPCAKARNKASGSSSCDASLQPQASR